MIKYTRKNHRDTAKLPERVKTNKPKRTKWKKRLWDAYSAYIRKRDGYTCKFHERIREKGISSPCVCNGVMQACHKVRRGEIFIDDRNVFCGCSGSNLWSKMNEVKWNELWHKLWPEDVDYLEKQARIVRHYDAWTCKVLIDEYKRRTDGLEYGA